MLASTKSAKQSGKARPRSKAGPQNHDTSHWYCRDEALIAVDAMNDALAYGIAKNVLESRRSIPKATAADPTADLKPFLSPAAK